jgi:hypothetical protein
MISNNHNNSQMIYNNNTMKKDNQFGLIFNGFVFGKKNERINWRKIGTSINRILDETYFNLFFY